MPLYIIYAQIVRNRSAAWQRNKVIMQYRALARNTEIPTKQLGKFYGGGVFEVQLWPTKALLTTACGHTHEHLVTLFKRQTIDGSYSDRKGVYVIRGHTFLSMHCNVDGHDKKNFTL